MDIKYFVILVFFLTALFWFGLWILRRFQRANISSVPASFLWICETLEALIKISTDIYAELEKHQRMNELDQVEGFLAELEALITRLHDLKAESFVTKMELEELALKATALIQRGKKIHGMVKKC